MTARHLSRPKFDPDANFFVVKPVLLHGTLLGPGQPFDKAQVPARRLRQLYDTRFLGLTPSTGLNPKEPESSHQELPPEVAPQETRAHVRPQRMGRVRLED